MRKHPITVALETMDLEGLAAALHPDVVFHSPILATVGDEVRGRDVVLAILGSAIQGFGVPQQVAEFQAEDGRYVIEFAGVMDGHRVEVLITVTEDADGKVVSFAPHMRPYPVVTRFREHMRANLCPDPIPESIWALPATV